MNITNEHRIRVVARAIELAKEFVDRAAEAQEKSTDYVEGQLEGTALAIAGTAFGKLAFSKLGDDGLENIFRLVDLVARAIKDDILVLPARPDTEYLPKA